MQCASDTSLSAGLLFFAVPTLSRAICTERKGEGGGLELLVYVDGHLWPVETYVKEPLLCVMRFVAAVSSTSMVALRRRSCSAVLFCEEPTRACVDAALHRSSCGTTPVPTRLHLASWTRLSLDWVG